MWVIGHTALGYFIARGGMKAIGKEFHPGLLPLIFIVANFPDYLHFHIFHMASHNFLAAASLTALLIMLINRFLPLERYEMVIIFFVGLSHGVGDLLFSVYYPLIPSDFSRYNVFVFNTPTALISEIVLDISFILCLIVSRDIYRLRDAAAKGVKRFFSSDTKSSDLVDPAYIPGFALLLFMATVTLETGLYTVLIHYRYQYTYLKIGLLIIMATFASLGWWAALSRLKKN